MNIRDVSRLLLSACVIVMTVTEAAPQKRRVSTQKPKTVAVAVKKPPQTIDWVKDLETANAISATDGRPVIAYFTFNACTWCKVLEEKTMTDPAVAEAAKKYVWVYVNRDVVPEIPKRFNVSAYPSLIVLGAKEENIHRFESYIKPPVFIAELEDGLRRYSLYRKGEKWDTPAERAARLTSLASYDTIKAPFDATTNHAKGEFPSGGGPSGITFLHGDMWIKQSGGTLFRLDAKTGAVKQRLEKLPFVTDICTDGEKLFAVSSGWTAGHPIYVIDPLTGKIVRELVAEENKKNKMYAARGITYVNGKLYVLGPGELSEVLPQTGAIVKTTKLEEKGLTGLDFNGKHFVSGNRTHLVLVDPLTGKTLKKTAVNYPLRSVAYHDGEYYLMEQPVFGFDTNNRTIQLWPRPGETMIYKLRLATEE